MKKIFTLVLLALLYSVSECRAEDFDDAMLTTLPLNVVGVMIFPDPAKNLVTILDKSEEKVYPIRVNEEIPKKALILKITPSKIFFLNTQAGRNEFVSMQGVIIPRPSPKTQ